jgi:hypothetical protein
MQVQVTVYRWSKCRQFSRLWTFAFVGLAFFVFTWGLQYKLSLYHPSQTASRRIPEAKLLSGDEQSRATESSLVVRTKISAKAMYLVPCAAFFVLLPVLGILNQPASGQKEHGVNRPWQLRRAILHTLFVRPPPVFA